MSRHPQVKKMARRTWRARGIRLNADTPIADVEISNLVLGSGSFGAVDVRVATWCGARVAAKTLHGTSGDNRRGSSSADESSLDLRSFTANQRRVLQECHLMGQLRHPNIAQVYGVFIRPNGSPVIVSELLGESLQQRLAFGTRLTYRDIVDVGLDLLQGLTYLHSLAHPLLHGSVCSSNALFSVTGSVKLTDCNLALAHLNMPPPSGAAADAMPEQHAPTVPVRDANSGAEALESGGARRSTSAMHYLPLDAQDHDCYDLSVDTYAFGILVMAMILHREPSIETKQNLVISLGKQQMRKMSPTQLERARRAGDLLALTESGSPLIELVERCLDCVPAQVNGDQPDLPGDESRDSVDCGVERSPSHELLQAVKAMKKDVEYARWPSTKATPLARNIQEQMDLVSAVHRLEEQVQATMSAAQASLVEQEKQLYEQVEELSKVHKQERGRLAIRIKQLEMELSTVRSANESLGPSRGEMDPDQDEEPGQLSGVRASTVAQHYRRAKSWMSGRRESDNSLRDMVSPESQTSDETDYPAWDDDEKGFNQEIRIKMPVGSGLATFQIDKRETTGEIVQRICEDHGIADYEEYSMLLEEGDAFYERARKESEKTRRTFRGERKLESIRKRWKGSEVSSLNWLQPDKTLQEQGIDPITQILTLKKHTMTPTPSPLADSQLHSSVTSVFDSEYQECKTSILDGSCPCTVDDACTLAALQCHIQLGECPENNKSKLKSVQEELKEFLPKDYQKSKTSLRKVLQKYSENSPNMSQTTAQNRYVAMCKSLPTYGATVFVVKTPAKSKGRLVACILAITKENILKLDEKSKEVLQLLPIRFMRRWVHSSDMVQMDFGEADPVSFLTHDAQSIANLISIYKGIRPKRGREHSVDLSDAHYEELPLKPTLPARPLPSVSRSESTVLPKSPQLSLIRRLSHEAPASVSLSTAKKSPLLGDRSQLPPKPSPPMYDILEPMASYDSSPSSLHASDQHLSPDEDIDTGESMAPMTLAERALVKDSPHGSPLLRLQEASLGESSTA